MKLATTSTRMKLVSIRGRFAFGVTCLEVYFEYLNLQKDGLVKELLENLWEFVSSNSLNSWENKIKEYLPSVILDEHPNNKFKNYIFLKKQQLLAYQKLYFSMPETAITMINLVAEIGLDNLYGGTGDYSESTLELTMQVVVLLNEMKLPLPELTRFERSKYSESHGWGNAVDRQFFAA